MRRQKVVLVNLSRTTSTVMTVDALAFGMALRTQLPLVGSYPPMANFKVTVVIHPVQPRRGKHPTFRRVCELRSKPTVGLRAMTRPALAAIPFITMALKALAHGRQVRTRRHARVLHGMATEAPHPFASMLAMRKGQVWRGKTRRRNLGSV